MRSNLVDPTTILHMERPLAVLVSDDGDRRKAVWLPERLAIDKGLV